MNIVLYNQEFKNHLTQLDDFKSISVENKENPFLIMSNLKDCNELHLLAHGSPGHLDLGTGINTEALYENAEYLSTLNVQKIILWGCNVGKNKKFIKTFSNITNSMIYASKDYLGKNKGISDEFPSMNNFIKSLPFYLTFGNEFVLTSVIDTGDLNDNDYFGSSASISGDYAIVGSPGADEDGEYGPSTDSGSVYIFYRVGANWTQQKKLINSDGWTEDGQFGNSISISGDYAIVGAYRHARNNTGAGSAYIFYKDEGGNDNWGLQQILTASDTVENNRFGYSVDISGDYVIVGESLDDTGSHGDSGSAHIYKRDGTNWIKQTKLNAFDLAAYDYFGYSVSISGETAIVGAPTGEDRVYQNGNLIPNQTLWNSGAAYIFYKDEGGNDNWGLQQRLKASDPDRLDLFGSSVKISGDNVIVGAKNRGATEQFLDWNYGQGTGAAYTFKRNGSTWTQTQILTVSDPIASDFIANSVDISEDYAIIGAPGKDNWTGRVYIFESNQDGSWGTGGVETQKLISDETVVDSYFGASVSISGETAIVGAPHVDNDGGLNNGSAYIYSLIQNENESTNTSANPCFLEGTPVLTDQGELSIEQITSENTIGNQKVVKITKIMNKDNYMILIKKDAFSQNVPSQDTYIGKNHGIYIDDKLVYANKLLLLKNSGITKEEIGHTYIYNVLLPTHSKMLVNNMIVETLDPNNRVV